MDHRDRELPVSEPIRYGAVSTLQCPLDLDFVPVFGVSDISEPEVILLGPEEWDRVKPFAVAKNVACRRLSLTLGHNKVFDADSFAGEPVRLTRDVAGSEYAWDARLEVFVDDDAAINGEPCSFR